MISFGQIGAIGLLGSMAIDFCGQCILLYLECGLLQHHTNIELLATLNWLHRGSTSAAGIVSFVHIQPQLQLILAYWLWIRVEGFSQDTSLIVQAYNDK